MKKLTLKTLFLLILLIKCELVLSQVCAAGSCSSSLSGTLSSGTYSNTAYCVSGNLTIDGVVSFTGCTLYMQNGANITVNSNKKLTFNNTHVLSCDQTNVWAGIHLWNGSNLGSYPRSLEIVNGSIMEDADILIWNASSNGILIENSFLNKNNTAIYFDGANTSTSTLEMYGTQITCYATSNNPSTRGPYVLAPYNDESTFGIFGSESGSKIIGDGSKNTNLFDNLTTAIYGYNMNLQIQNNSFDYCGFTNTSNSSYPYVISVENAGSVNNLLIGGASPSDGNSFSNSQYWGINVLNRTNTIIQNNYFNEVEKPIKIQNIQSSGNIAFPISIDISFNTLFKFDMGIQLYRCQKVSSGIIQYNYFNPSDDLSYNSTLGIDLNNSNIYQQNVYINNNEIRNCRTAIRANNLSTNFGIIDNEIYIHNSAPATQYTGMELINILGANVQGNNIHNLHTSIYNRVIGVRANRYTFGKINYNTFDNTGTAYRGIHSIGVNNGTQFECNLPSSCPEAFYFGTTNSPSFINDQGGSSATNDNSFNPLNNSYYRMQGAVAATARWYYKGTSSTGNETFPYSNVFLITPNLTSVDNSQCNVNLFLVRERDIDPIINGSYSFEENEDEYWYNLKAELFRYLIINDEYLDNEIYITWFDEQDNSNLAKLIRLENIAFDSDPASEEEFDEIIATAISDLENITPDNQIEENKILYLGLVLNKILQNIELSSGDLFDLGEIACQNSILGGEAVLWARSYLNLDIDDEDGCESKIGRTVSNSTNEPKGVSIYPNPSNGEINITSSDLEYNLEVYDILGNLTTKFSVSSGNKEYQFHLKEGFYVYNLIAIGESKSIIGKLIISK